MIEQEVRFGASKTSGEVSAILVRPLNARWLMALAHGAGAGIRHAFMTGLAQSLAKHGIATFRYQFPYKIASSFSLLTMTHPRAALLRDYTPSMKAC